MNEERLKELRAQFFHCLAQNSFCLPAALKNWIDCSGAVLELSDGGMKVKSAGPALKDNEVSIRGPIESDENGRIIKNWWGIDCVTPTSVAERLGEIQGDVVLRINSPGGNVWAASAIYQLLVDRKKEDKLTGVIEGISASAATLVMLPCSHLEMAVLANVMIHRVWGIAIGNGTEITSYGESMTADDNRIAGLYSKRSGGETSAKSFREKMDAETWMTSEQAVACGLVDSVGDDGIDSPGEDDKKGAGGSAPANETSGEPADPNLGLLQLSMEAGNA